MSIIYNDTNERSDLQRKIAAELREKQASKPLVDGAKLSGDNAVNEFDDPEYTRDFRATSTTGLWVIAVIAVAGLAILAIVTMQ